MESIDMIETQRLALLWKANPSDAIFEELLEHHRVYIEIVAMKYKYFGFNEMKNDLKFEFYMSLLSFDLDYGEANWKPTFTLHFFTYTRNYIRKLWGLDYHQGNGGYATVDENGKKVRRKGKKINLDVTDLQYLSVHPFFGPKKDTFDDVLREQSWLQIKDRYKISDKKWLILNLKLQGFKQAEIGEKVGLTQARVSTIIKKMGSQHPGLYEAIKEMTLK